MASLRCIVLARPEEDRFPCIVLDEHGAQLWVRLGQPSRGAAWSGMCGAEAVWAERTTESVDPTVGSPEEIVVEVASFDEVGMALGPEGEKGGLFEPSRSEDSETREKTGQSAAGAGQAQRRTAVLAWVAAETEVALADDSRAFAPSVALKRLVADEPLDPLPPLSERGWTPTPPPPVEPPTPPEVPVGPPPVAAPPSPAPPAPPTRRTARLVLLALFLVLAAYVVFRPL